jgi:hypothetical protein
MVESIGSCERCEESVGTLDRVVGAVELYVLSLDDTGEAFPAPERDISERGCGPFGRRGGRGGASWLVTRRSPSLCDRKGARCCGIPTCNVDSMEVLARNGVK